MAGIAQRIVGQLKGRRTLTGVRGTMPPPSRHFDPFRIELMQTRRNSITLSGRLQS